MTLITEPGRNQSKYEEINIIVCRLGNLFYEPVVGLGGWFSCPLIVVEVLEKQLIQLH